MKDEVTVGDLNSSERGSGARKGKNKPQWWQLPLFALDGIDMFYPSEGAISVWDVIQELSMWQRDRSFQMTLPRAIANLLYLLAEQQNINPSVGVPLRALESTTRVLEFGAKKYPATEKFAIGTDGRPTPAAAGNWAKGMPWSVCLSCALSHLFAHAGGDVNDEESGISHLAHAMCNLLFLRSYETLYPEGDDRIPQFECRLSQHERMTGAEEYQFQKVYWDGDKIITESIPNSAIYKDPEYWGPGVVDMLKDAEVSLPAVEVITEDNP